MGNHAKMITVLAILLALVFGLALGGCGGYGNDVIGTYKTSVIHESVGGRDIQCITIRTTHGAGISCDWNK